MAQGTSVVIETSSGTLGRDGKLHAWMGGETRCICGCMISEDDDICFNGAVDLSNGTRIW